MNKKVIIITHSGSFHPDDVFAVASLELLLEKRGINFEVLRTREKDMISRGDFVVDVGGLYEPEKNYFDHHQEGGAGQRENAVPYASFGLVWKKYGSDICGSVSVAGEIERKLVIQIDALDNGVELVSPLISGVRPYLLNHVIFSYLPTWKEKDSADEAFLGAVAFAKNLLKKEIKIASDKIEGEVQVEEIYRSSKDKRVLVLDREYFWLEIVGKYPEPLFVIYPQENGNFHVKAVREDLNSFKTRILFPETWAGKRDEELAQITGVSDALFCHNKRFLVVAKTKEGALMLAHKALDL